MIDLINVQNFREYILVTFDDGSHNIAEIFMMIVSFNELIDEIDIRRSSPTET